MIGLAVVRSVLAAGLLVASGAEPAAGATMPSQQAACNPTGLKGHSEMPEFLCDYNSDEAYRRIRKLLDPETQSLKVEDVSNLFGVPLLNADDRSTRVQNYLTVLGGRDGWRIVLDLSEGYYPADQGPAKFVPGQHPKRLDRFESSRRTVQIFFEEASLLKRDSAHCPQPSSLVSVAEAKGWTESKEIVVPTDGGQAPPAFDGPHGRHLVVEAGFGLHCGQQLAFYEAADGALSRQ